MQMPQRILDIDFTRGLTRRMSGIFPEAIRKIGAGRAERIFVLGLEAERGA
jgi:hypothetical protein